MSASAPCPPDSPLMIAWTAYKATEEYPNTKKWAAYPEHIEGSLWAAFMAGFNAQSACISEGITRADLPSYTAEHLAANYPTRTDTSILSGPYTPTYIAAKRIEVAVAERDQLASMDDAAMDKMQAMIREQSERIVAVASYAELASEALREIHRTAHGFDHPALLRIVGLAKLALAKEPTTQFSAHPADSDAGVKLTPAETVRYDPAPECKGEIAARERLEPEGRRGADGTVSVAELDAQNGVTGRRDGHFLHQSCTKSELHTAATALYKWLVAVPFQEPPMKRFSIPDEVWEPFQDALFDSQSVAGKKP